MTDTRKALIMSVLMATTLMAPVARAESPIALEDGFRDPPQDARPRVWWHWMNGNITKDGIAKDLAWLKEVGIGGVQNFDASLDTPQIVPQRLVYMTPEWKEAFRFAVSEADRHGLEFAIAASPGWSVTGGPWVKPEDGMKKLVWGELQLPGGRRYSGALPPLPTTTGPYQNLPYADMMPGQSGGKSEKPTAAGQIAVLAVPATQRPLPLPRYALADGTTLPADVLTDADLTSGAALPLTSDRRGAVSIRFDRPVTVRSVRLFIPGLKLPFRGVPLRASIDAREGAQWRPLAEVPLTSVPTTQALPETRAREFRLRLEDSQDKGNLDLLNAAPGAVAINFFDSGPLTSVTLADLQLSPEARVDRAAEKAGFETVPDYHALTTSGPASPAPAPAEVIDLTNRLTSDGQLNWTPPKGRDWHVMRFGWSLTGKTNHPATPEATGLEVDKYDGDAVRRYLQTYLGMYREATGPALFGTRGLGALLTDSIEVGNANWTAAMEREFESRRGYELRPWLPALAGAVLGTPAETDRFLFDFRQTLAELLADRHYATVAQVAREQGLTVYGEALEDKRPMLGNDLAMRRHADVPMAALWTWPKNGALRTTLIGDMKGAASVAHVYGKRHVAAESMTSVNAPWDFAPKDLKPVIDLEFASGVTRPVIHTSVHQPLDAMKPGLSLAIFGQYFNRHESWAPLARPWIDYLARTSFLLQQGRNVADVAWFIGEDAPVTALFADGLPANLPKAHAYDVIDATMLAEALRVDGGQLVSSGGARYQALYLGGSARFMTLPTLRRLAGLVRGGATLIGVKPERSPSQADDPAAFARLADALWSGDHGRGRVIATAAIDDGLAQAGISPGFRFDGGQPETRIAFVEREIADGRLFYLSNPGEQAATITARFRSQGKRPELWNAETGARQPLSFRIKQGETLVPMTLAPHDAAFVMLREDTQLTQHDMVEPKHVAAGALGGPWAVSFEAERGAPATLAMTTLHPLHQNSDPAIRYFSGIARYAQTFASPKGWTSGQPLWLDLGEVHDVAEVWLNGTRVGGLWRAPWRIDIGSAARQGPNQVEIRVANKWVNRLIGDAQPGATPIAKIAAPGYRADAPLRPSGLAGPVTLWAEAR